MKNRLVIDIDTERENVVDVGKFPDFPLPKKGDEGFSKKDKQICVDDIKTMAEGIIKVSSYMDVMGYQNMKDLIDEVKLQLDDGLEDYLEQTKK